MSLHTLPYLIILLLGCVCAAPAADDSAAEKSAAPQELEGGDLNTDASTYVRRYSDWGGGYPGNNYNNNYATGYGLLDDKYNGYGAGYNGGFSGYSGYSGYGGNTGYGYKGYAGYDGGVGGVGGVGYNSQSALGNGGYGGYGGNGGLTSYYGYQNPYYQGAYHLGYGYRKPGYGNIYNSGITPSLVTGYRGYSRR